MSEPIHDNSNTPDEAGSTQPPSRPGDAAAPSIGALVVVSPAAIAHFAPPSAGTTILGSSDPGDGVVLVARLPRGPIHDGNLVGRRVAYQELRILGEAATRLIVLISDGPALAAALGVPDTMVAFTEDGGNVTAVARVAAAVGLTPREGWPEDEEGRLAILVRLLQAAGHHPHAPVRLVRLCAYALAINAEPVPVPMTAEELIRFGRVAGFGAEALSPGCTLGDAWPAHLGAEERAAMPDEQPVHALFREAAGTLARLAPATPDESSPQPDADGAA